MAASWFLAAGFVMLTACEVYLLKVVRDKKVKIVRPSGDPWDKSFSKLSLNILDWYRILLYSTILRNILFLYFLFSWNDFYKFKIYTMTNYRDDAFYVQFFQIAYDLLSIFSMLMYPILLFA